MTKFDALIIGGGLSGITTAHRLAKRGCSIAIAEVNKEVGLGANYANGAMLVPSQSSPFNSPGVFSDIRNLFANVPESKIRGYKAGRFSFNVVGGRCEN